MTPPTRSGVAAVLAAAAVLLLAPASALAACPRTSLAEIENEVMCPVCKTPLATAQKAPQADRQRAFILDRIERCQSEAEIKAALTREFGDEVLAMPERRGFDLAAYVVPAAALLLAVGTGTAAIVRWRRRRPGAGPTAGPRTAGDGDAAEGGKAAPGADDSPAARLERDLARYDT